MARLKELAVAIADKKPSSHRLMLFGGFRRLQLLSAFVYPG
jgi:hypothetical protein